MTIGSNRIWYFFLIWVTFVSNSLASEAKFASPLNIGEHTVQLNGMKLWYKVSGTGPICLMPTPAWGPSSVLYYRTLQSIEKHFTIVYIDSRGTGRSGRAKTLQGYTWDHLIGDLETLRAHLEQDSIWLMGHSAGGAQILQYACKHRNRVSGLVLLDAMAVIDVKWEADVKKRLNWRKGNPLYEDALRAWQLQPTKNDPELKDEDVKRWLDAVLPLYWSDPTKIKRFKDDFAAWTLSAEAYMGSELSRRYPLDLRIALKNVKAPTLIVVGDDSFCCSPESATIMHLALPNSKLLLIEKCGHFPWLEQPSIFETRVSEFLQALGLCEK